MDSITLREYVDCLFAEREKQMNDKFKAADDALALSKENLQKDLQHLNALRAEVQEDRAVFARLDFVQTLEKRIAVIEGRWGWMYLIGAGLVTIVGWLAYMLFQHIDKVPK